MKQFLTNDGEPLFQYLPVENEQERLALKRHCPFIGLDRDAETIMAYPTSRNYCHRLNPAQGVRTDYQRTHCLTFAHRHCPVLLGHSSKSLPPEIAVTPARRRPIYLILSIASVFVLLIVAFLLFGGWQWTSANGWFFDTGSEGPKREVIVTPGILQAKPEEPAPTELPANIQPASGSLQVEMPDSDQAPVPTPTPIPSTET